MEISRNMFYVITGALAVGTLLLLPFWPYSTWGWVPSIVAAGVAGMMFMFRALSTD